MRKSLESNQVRDKPVHVRPGPKMFAVVNKLTRKGGSSYVSALKDKSEKTMTTEEDIGETFATFYQDLYAARAHRTIFHLKLQILLQPFLLIFVFFLKSLVILITLLVHH